MTESAAMTTTEDETAADCLSLLATETTQSAKQSVSNILFTAADGFGIPGQVMALLNDRQSHSGKGESKFQSLPTLIRADNCLHGASSGTVSPLLSTEGGTRSLADSQVCTGQHTNNLAKDEEQNWDLKASLASSGKVGCGKLDSSCHKAITSDTSFTASTNAAGSFMTMTEDAVVATAASMTGT